MCVCVCVCVCVCGERERERERERRSSDMYKNDGGQARVCEAHEDDEVKQRLALVKAPVYFIN